MLHPYTSILHSMPLSPLFATKAKDNLAQRSEELQQQQPTQEEIPSADLTATTETIIETGP